MNEGLGFKSQEEERAAVDFVAPKTSGEQSRQENAQDQAALTLTKEEAPIQEAENPPLSEQNNTAGQTESLSPEANSETKVLREFTKHYSPEARSHIAFIVRNKRHQLRKKNMEIQAENTSRTEDLTRQQQELQLEANSLNVKKEELVGIVDEMTNDLDRQKKSIKKRILTLFGQSNGPLVEGLDGKLSELKTTQLAIDNVNERFKIVEGLTVLTEEYDVLRESKEILNSFYQEQSEVRQSLETEEKERDLAEISKEHQAFFVHGIAINNEAMNYATQYNNNVIDTANVGLDTKLDLLIGLQPTVSASTVRAGKNDHTFYEFGVVLKAGRVLSAYKEDELTVASNIYSRRSANINPLESSVQPNIQETLDSSIDKRSPSYNELVVENPEIAGLYVDLNMVDLARVDINDVIKLSRERSLPILGRKDGIMFKLSPDNTWLEISVNDTLHEGRAISDSERLNLAERVVESSPFPIKKEVVSNFDAYLLGSNYYDLSTQALGDSDNQKSWYGSFEGSYYIEAPNNVYCPRTDTKPGDGPEGFIAFMGEGLDKLQQSSRMVRDSGMNPNDSMTKTIVSPQDFPQALIELQGFADAAQRAGDEHIYSLAISELKKYDPNLASERFARERISENGTLRALDKDVPPEVVERISQLSARINDAEH